MSKTKDNLYIKAQIDNINMSGASISTELHVQNNKQFEVLLIVLLQDYNEAGGDFSQLTRKFYEYRRHCNSEIKRKLNYENIKI